MEEKKQQAPLLEPLTSAKEIEEAIEAIVYAAGHPMRYDKLAEVLSLTVKDVKTMVNALAERYNAKDATHGIRLQTFPTTCQFCTDEAYAPYIREALGIRRGGNLSASSMEVLAVVAYNQPVTRSFVDLVRGVDSSYAVSSLLDKGLIEAAGRLDAPGRPMLYVTTDKFLRVFGLQSLDELPETEALSVAAAQAEQLRIKDGEASADAEETTDTAETEEPSAVGSEYTPVPEEEELD
jgi:segregation and condensation protein B